MASYCVEVSPCQSSNHGIYKRLQEHVLYSTSFTLKLKYTQKKLMYEDPHATPAPFKIIQNMGHHRRMGPIAKRRHWTMLSWALTQSNRSSCLPFSECFLSMSREVLQGRFSAKKTHCSCGIVKTVRISTANDGVPMRSMSCIMLHLWAELGSALQPRLTMSSATSWARDVSSNLKLEDGKTGV